MLTENKNILLKDKSKKGFTLVELIIVITILAILATIAFISLQGYSKNSRDANRLTSLNNIKKGLDIYYTKSATLPAPETPIAVYYSGTLIGQQGYFGDSISRLAGFNKIPLDPLDNTKYTYSINSDLNKFQALALMETSDYLSFGDSVISKSYAANDYSSRSPKTIGYDLGILLGTGGTDLNKPIQEYYTNTGVDLKTNTGFTAIINNSKSISGDNLAFLKHSLKNGFDNSLVGYWDMETMYSSGGSNYIRDLSGNGGDCTSNSTNTQTGGLKGNALFMNDKAGGVQCTVNFQTGSEFTLFSTYGYSSGMIMLQDNGWIQGFQYKINNPYYVNYFTGNIVPMNQKNLNKNSNDNSWNITTISYDGKNSFKIYENGVYIDTVYSESPFPLYKIAYGGGINNITRAGSKGTFNIDDMKLYNKVLNDNQIMNIYNQMK